MAWKKGQSGNPNGRPKKGNTFAEIVDKYLNGHYADDESKPKRILALAKKLFVQALHGDVRAARLLLEYKDGRPPQKQILTTDEEEPFVINIQYGNRSE